MKSFNHKLASRETRHFLLAFALLLLSLLAYSPVFQNKFISYDDIQYITDNPALKAGITFTNIKWAFTTGYRSNWHPLTWLSHMLDYELYGLDPIGHHLTNLLFHMANTIFLFFIFQRMTSATWRSAFVAAVFALHPLHVESVAWAAQRKDVMCTLFAMLTILSYIYYCQAQRLLRYLLVVFSFALALMSKPMVVTLPFVMLLLDFWPLKRLLVLGTKKETTSISWKPIVEKIPLLALTIASSIVTFFTQQHTGATKALGHLDMGMRLSNALISYIRYLFKIFWPKDLAIFYPYATSPWPIWQTIAAAILLAAISIFVCWCFRAHPYLFVGWFWYVGTLVPVIGLVQVGWQAMADRYTYIPLIGIAVATAWGLPNFWRFKYFPPKGWAVLTGAVVVTLLILTRMQVSLWKDTQTLFTHALKVTQNNWLAYDMVGIVLGKQRKVNQAIEYFEKSIQLYPGHWKTHNNLGVALALQGRSSEAISSFHRALQLNPKNEEAHFHLGVTFTKKGQLDEAISSFRNALQANPYSGTTHYQLAIALDNNGQIDEAIQHYRESIHHNPENADAYNNLGAILFRRGRIDDAIKNYQKSISLIPNHVNAHYNLGLAFTQKGLNDAAVVHFQEVLRISPNHHYARSNLERLQKGRKK